MKIMKRTVKESVSLLTTLMLCVFLHGCGSQQELTAADSSSEVSVSDSSAAEIIQPARKHTFADIEADNDGVWKNDSEVYSDFIGKLALDRYKNGKTNGEYLIATDDDILFFFANDEYENDSKTRINAYSTFEIGSVTKTFTAVSVLQLAERGKLSLNDTLDKYFPKYEKGKDITIDQLLHMRGGIYDYCDENEIIHFFGKDDPETQHKIWFDGFTDEEFLQALYNADLRTPPGTATHYSNTEYHLLGMIIEQVSGISYAEYLEKNIFGVCGMKHSSATKTGDVTTVPKAVGDAANNTDNGYFACQNISRGDGDIHSCAADLLAFDRALKNGRLVSEDSLAGMFDTKSGYGCGIMKFAGHQYGHEGATFCYTTENYMLDNPEFGTLYFIKLTHS